MAPSIRGAQGWVLRPLQWKGRGAAETIATLQRWYEEVLGTPYQLTLGKIIAGTTGGGGGGGRALARPAPAKGDKVADQMDDETEGEAASSPPGFLLRARRRLLHHARSCCRGATRVGLLAGQLLEGASLPLVEGAVPGDEIPIEFGARPSRLERSNGGSCR